MTTAPFFSRATLKKTASMKALAPLLLGRQGKGGPNRQPGHHLVWSLFADTDRKRDFLWREMNPGVFLILSARIPEDRHELFEIDEPKPFAPALESGDRLAFSLRANPVIRRRIRGQRRSSKHDVVMNALRDEKRVRANRRFAAVQKHGLAWLEAQSGKAGFSVQPSQVRVDGYKQHRIARRGDAKFMCYSTMDFEGILTVDDPAVFLSTIVCGFGTAKAYGCGLMLIRRA